MRSEYTMCVYPHNLDNVASEDVEMEYIEQKLSYLLLGQNGGLNRTRIIEELSQRPYNLNQLATKLGLNYRTIKHHITILENHNLITTSRSGGYGEVYFLSKQMEESMGLFTQIARKLTNVLSSPKFFQNTLEQIHEGVIIIDGEGKIIFWNSAAKVQYGYEGKEMIGENISFLFGQELLEKLMMSKDTWNPMKNDIIKVKHSSGAFMNLAVSIDKIQGQDGNFNAFSIMSTDASQIREKQHALSELDSKYTVLQKKIPSMVARIDNEKRLVSVSSPGGDLGGFPWKDFIGKAIEELGLNKEHTDIWQKKIEEIFRTEIPEVLEFDIPGTIENTQVTGNFIPEIDSEGNLSTIMLVANPVTKKKVNENRNQNFYSSQYDNPSPIFRIGHGGKIIFSNPCAKNLFDNWQKALGSTVPVELLDTVEEVLSIGENIGLTMISGERVFYLMIVPITDQNYANIYGYDITNLKPTHEDLSIHFAELKEQHEELQRLQDELQTTADKYSNLYDFAPIGFFSLDERGKILGLNLTGAHLLGWERYHLLGKSFTNRLEKSERGPFQSLLQQLFSNREPLGAEMEMMKKDKSIVKVRFEFSMSKEEGQNQCRIAVIPLGTTTHRK